MGTILSAGWGYLHYDDMSTGLVPSYGVKKVTNDSPLAHCSSGGRGERHIYLLLLIFVVIKGIRIQCRKIQKIRQCHIKGNRNLM